MTVSEKLEQINTIKGQIMDAVNQKGGNLTSVDPFSAYPGAISSIPSGGGTEVPEDSYLISVESEDSEMGSVSGGGVASEGMIVTVKATPADPGYSLEGWYEDDEFQSGEREYGFLADRNRNLVAKFGDTYMAGRDWFAVSLLQNSYSILQLAYGSGYFVLIRADGIIKTSRDGVKWIGSASVPGLSASSVPLMVINDDNLVIFIQDTNTEYIGTIASDGTVKNLTRYALPATASWTQIISANGFFVAVATDMTGFLYSSDGINWAIFNTTNSYNTLTYADGIFILCNLYGTYITHFHPIDGTVLGYSTGKSGAASSYIAYEDGLLVIRYSGDSNMRFSVDLGQHWSSMSVPGTVSNTVNGVVSGNGMFVYIANGISMVSVRRLKNSGAFEWYSIRGYNMEHMHRATYGNGIFLAADRDNFENLLFSSSRGILP